MGAEVLLFAEQADSGLQDCQRCAEFMAYIGKEAEFHLIQFFFLSFLQLPLIHSQITVKSPIYGKGNQQAINEISQRSFPIRVLYNDLYSCTVTSPLLTVAVPVPVGETISCHSLSNPVSR